MNLKWFKGLGEKKEDRAYTKALFADSLEFRKLLLKVIEESYYEPKINSILTAKTEGEGNWVIEQAKIVGYLNALKDIQNLIEK